MKKTPKHQHYSDFTHDRADLF